ncbi:MAG: hypothetical protein ACKPFF_01900, partial [Planktothrix sp.]
MADNRLRNFLIGAGIVTAGAIGTKMAVDYFKNRGKEEVVDESQGDAIAASPEQVSYAVVQPSSVQSFLDASFGEPGRYVPIREPKVFDYQGQQYMVIWAKDNKKPWVLEWEHSDQVRQNWHLKSFVQNSVEQRHN